jgi:membrane protease YdiL (CAAX protease family)
VIGFWPIVVTYLLVRAFWLTLDQGGRLLDSPVAPGVLKLALWVVPSLILTIAISRLTAAQTWREFGLGRGLRTGLLFGILATIPMAAATVWTGIKGPGLAELVGVAVLDPVGESVLFSGFLFSQLQRWRWRAVSALIVSALLFSVAHADGTELDLLRMLYYGRADLLWSTLQWFVPRLVAGAVGGLLFTWVFYRWGSLWPAIFLHAAINFWWTLSPDGKGFIQSVWDTASVTGIGHGLALAVAVGATLRLTPRPTT